MDFSLSDEQEAMAGLARQIFTDKATPERMTALEKSGGPRFDRELWSEAAKAGLVGIAVPEDLGGAGMGFFELALIAEQLGITVAPIPFIETAVLGALPIEHFGSDAQKQEILPRVARGEMVLTAALVEDQLDPMEPATTAVPDGNGWKLSGTKICVPAGQLADRILVSARTDDGRIGVFIVDPTAQGCSLDELATTSGQPEAHLVLAGVGVGEGDVLGSLDRGRETLDWIIQHGTSALCSLALGVCEEALRLTAEYTKGREQFGQAIATFQAVGQRAADAYIDTEGIRLTSWHAAWRLGEGLPAASQVATAKVWAADAGQRIVHAASHLHGGMGVDKDYPLFRYFTYAKQLELTLGGATAQLMKLGRLLAEDAA
jgi:alkylation response protein AidB-like acyl-CoA dehydrogenase